MGTSGLWNINCPQPQDGYISKSLIGHGILILAAKIARYLLASILTEFCLTPISVVMIEVQCATDYKM